MIRLAASLTCALVEIVRFVCRWSRTLYDALACEHTFVRLTNERKRSFRKDGIL